MKKILLPLLFAGLAAAANAQIVYEPFNYSVGNFNTGAAGPATTATGLTGNWTWTQNGDSNSRTTVIQSGSIQVRNAETANNKLNWGTAPGSGSANNFLYSSLSSGASTALGVTSGQSKTLWMSWALTSAGAGTPTVELRNSTAGGTGGIVFGINANVTSSNVQILANNAAQATSSSFTFTTGQDYLLVAKLTYSMSGATTSFDSGSVWALNDTGLLPTNEVGLGSALASFSTPVTSSANRTPSFLRLSNGSSGFSNTFDEIRIGTSFDSVVIPEPGTWVLLAGGLTSVLVFRRRRQS